MKPNSFIRSLFLVFFISAVHPRDETETLLIHETTTFGSKDTNLLCRFTVSRLFVDDDETQRLSNVFFFFFFSWRSKEKKVTRLDEDKTSHCPPPNCLHAVWGLNLTEMCSVWWWSWWWCSSTQVFLSLTFVYVRLNQLLHFVLFTSQHHTWALREVKPLRTDGRINTELENKSN